MLKLKILTAFDNYVLHSLGPFYRSIAKRLIKAGNDSLGSNASDDRLVKCLKQVSHNGQIPSIASALFTAPNSVIVGRVRLGENSTVWYGATLRGDASEIVVGKNAIIQDNAYVKASTEIGNNAYVGPNCQLESCRVGEDAFVGMGSVVSKGARVEGVVAAGSLVPENSHVRLGEIWAGSPAKYLRDITAQELQLLREYKVELSQLAQIHAEECGKSFRQIVESTDNRIYRNQRSHEEAVLEKLAELNFPLDMNDEEFMEHRVFMRDVQPPITSENLESTPEGYEQDLSLFPENIRKYGEDFELYEEAKRYFEQNPNAKAEQFPPKRQLHDDESWSRKY